MPRLGRKQKIIDRIARELHMMCSYSTIVAVHTITKLNDPNLTPEEKEEQAKHLDALLGLSETLYDDLTNEQKDLYLEQARNLF